MLAVWLNGMFPTVPPGTLAASLVGGYLIGVCLALFAHQTSLPPEWRLTAITGLLGGLTPFSTFSAEVTTLLQHGRLPRALGAIAIHVTGSLPMTFAGIASHEALRR